MIFVENELHHVNEADTVTKGKSANAKDNAKGKYRDKVKGDAMDRDKRQDTRLGRNGPWQVAGTRGKSQPNSRKRQIEDLANHDAALVLVDEEEEGLLIQKI